MHVVRVDYSPLIDLGIKNYAMDLNYKCKLRFIIKTLFWFLNVFFKLINEKTYYRNDLIATKKVFLVSSRTADK